jgi:hypothetical protein
MAATTTQNVTGNVTLLFGAQAGTATPMLVVNLDTANTVWVGNTSLVSPGGTQAIPLGPQCSLAFDGSSALYAVCEPGTSLQIGMIPGGTSYFLPASLSSIGGAKVYVQGGAPAGNIPVNSIWFNTTNGSLQTWNGSAWVNEQFSAQSLIQAATILGTQIADQAVTASKVADGTLTASQLAAAAGILGTQIANATITSGNIAANTIVASNIAANTITGAKIAANTITSGNIQANTIGVSQLVANLVYAGIVNGTTITGATFVATGTSGEILVYNGTPATGNLILSVSPVAGTDSHSNSFPAGLALINGKQVLQIHNNSTFVAPAIEMITGNVSESQHASLYNLGVNVGNVNTEYENVVIQGPASTSDGAQAQIILNSSSRDGSSNHASGSLKFNNANMVQWGAGGLSYTTPGGLTGNIPATKSNFPNTNVSGAFANLSTAWPIPADDANHGTVYRIKGYGVGAVTSASRVDFQVAGFGFTTGRTSIASGIFAAGTNVNIEFEATVHIGIAGASATGYAHIMVMMTTAAGDATPSNSVNTTFTTPLSGFTTQTATTLAVQYQSAVSGATQGVCYADTFERLGP